MTLLPAATMWSRADAPLSLRNPIMASRSLLACRLAIVVSWSLLLPIANAGDHDETVANVVRQFPSADRLPGAYSVRRIDSAGAVRCLVHIRDFHDTSDTKERGRRVVHVVQEDIVQIIEAMVRQQLFPFTGVHVEGLVGGVTPVKGQSGTNAKARDRIRQIVEEELSNVSLAHQQPARHPSAVQRVHHRLGLKLYSAEHSATYQAALQATQSVETDVSSRAQKLLADRENALLGIVAGAEAPVAVAVFGGGHDWSDNVAAWNRTHPTMKFSLIEITPRAYQWCVVDGKNIASLRRFIEESASVLAQADSSSRRQ